ncbi:MAG: hypothetical protein QOI53_3812 [Verrucomicrobiota bacterium]|nr:hypothetical protein [Verrucomicrobiota bacterium]
MRQSPAVSLESSRYDGSSRTSLGSECNRDNFVRPGSGASNVHPARRQRGGDRQHLIFGSAHGRSRRMGPLRGVERGCQFIDDWISARSGQRRNPRECRLSWSHRDRTARQKRRSGTHRSDEVRPFRCSAAGDLRKLQLACCGYCPQKRPTPRAPSWRSAAGGKGPENSLLDLPEKKLRAICRKTDNF